MYLSGITYEELKMERDEIRNVTREDIRELAELIKAVLDEGNICVIGNEGKVEANRSMFKCVKNLMK
jgi:Zn-dependent M16 (insulinase) family peptidase